MAFVTPSGELVPVETLSNNVYHTPPYQSLKSDGTSSEANTQLSSSDFVSFITDVVAGVHSKSHKRINNSKTSIANFLKEVTKRAHISRDILLLASIYFDKLIKSHEGAINVPEFAYCGKRLLLVCIILAHKFSNDITFSMRVWTQVSGLPTRSIAIMERWCLKQLNYGLTVTNEAMTSWGSKLAGYEQRHTTSVCTLTSIANATLKRKMELDDNVTIGDINPRKIIRTV
ncbi:uncharacterized protein HLK63_J10681 [Nakaseomyces glabratus]|nr:uncharacterized protein GW608_J10681 [Nakaseomyces glabratus]UCS27212.1 uncharacterized protein HLK63_J10681 [Nakaseomyces glabratus]UCS32441.1 uncharacterized protein HLK64_J10681 [Nakaseomyces glabratus]UCS37670.1 uncharacterized protein HLK62_J10681 [Nakaseomyces glabratus]